MPEWLIERGIGETRSVRIRDGEIVEARVLLDGTVPAGTVLEARLLETGIPAVAIAEGQQYLLPKGAPHVSEGTAIRIEVTRELLPGVEPWKRPVARITDEMPRPAQPLDAEYLPFPSPHDRLTEAGWQDFVEEARSGIVRFSGGELRISPTPAMTLIDVDGRLPPFELATAAAVVAAHAILRHGIGGSIGIDLPTISGKAQRQAVGAAIDAALPQPFERTAMNGFGFIQVVRPRVRASMFELAFDRIPFEARALLRRAAMECRGRVRLAAHPSIVTYFERNRAFLDRLAREIGGTVALRSDPALPIHGGHAENF